MKVLKKLVGTSSYTYGGLGLVYEKRSLNYDFSGDMGAPGILGGSFDFNNNHSSSKSWGTELSIGTEFLIGRNLSLSAETSYTYLFNRESNNLSNSPAEQIVLRMGTHFLF